MPASLSFIVHKKLSNFWAQVWVVKSSAPKGRRIQGQRWVEGAGLPPQDQL